MIGVLKQVEYGLTVTLAEAANEAGTNEIAHLGQDVILPGYVCTRRVHGEESPVLIEGEAVVGPPPVAWAEADYVPESLLGRQWQALSARRPKKVCTSSDGLLNCGIGVTDIRLAPGPAKPEDLSQQPADSAESADDVDGANLVEREQCLLEQAWHPPGVAVSPAPKQDSGRDTSGHQPAKPEELVGSRQGAISGVLARGRAPRQPWKR
jgi:hypothetical protein